MTMEKIVVGRIVAKLRNSVPVCLIDENGKEVKRYNNIEFPDELKTLEAAAFGFNIGLDDKITFNLCFNAGVLPNEFPAKRKSVSRAAQAAAKAAALNSTDLATAAGAIEEIANSETMAAPESRAYTEVRFDVTGDQRKELVAAVGELTGNKPIYQGAPSFAYVSGDVRIDKAGTLTGEIPQALIDALAERGFIAKAVA